MTTKERVPVADVMPADRSLRFSNAQIAQQLDAIAKLLEAQDANPYRVRAYRAGAQTLRELQRPAADMLEAEGVAGLQRLPAIGASLARSIEQLLDTGTINLLEHLRSGTDPERVLAIVSGIGPELAARIHEQLGTETLAGLEAAAYDGRLAQVPGVGTKRLRGVAEALAGRFRRPQVPEAARRQTNPPPIAELLDVDHEYRCKAKAGKLPRIAPRRFNPTGERWLPVLHTERGSAHYTALFSNTARAHEGGALKDWVVIYRDDRDGAGQWTLVTALIGSMKGKRIVRGREAECEAYYTAGGMS